MTTPPYPRAPTLASNQINLAHLHLLAGRFDRARQVYLKYARQPANDEHTYAQTIRMDFAQLRWEGIDHPDMARIESILPRPATP